jgi:hypothetical protein
VATMIALRLYDAAETPHFAKAESIDNLVQRGQFTELHMASGAQFNVIEKAEYILGLIPSSEGEIIERIRIENVYRERCC